VRGKAVFGTAKLASTTPDRTKLAVGHGKSFAVILGHTGIEALILISNSECVQYGR
jgi:hypothetical protein